jgi:class 3 adenylate cyclase
MAGLPEDPILNEVARRLADLRWAAMLVDTDLRIRFISDEFRGFVGVDDDEILGYGENVIAAFMQEVWRERIDVDSQTRIFTDLIPYLIYMLPDSEKHVLDDLIEPFNSLIDQIEPKPPMGLVSTWFSYVLEGEKRYRVNLAAMPLTGPDWSPVGFVVLTYVDVRPQLVSMLTQGDESMYERMATLVEPGRRQAAILFADVEGSGAISRQMPSAGYFALIRRLAMCVDQVIADNDGVVGKHAGDGMTGFFLVDDLGSPSRAAAAAIRSARQIKEATGLAFDEVAGQLGMEDDVPFEMNLGLHWGGTLYMGQLHPGSRLDVTALGDEMNECARIQESARGGAILASKGLLEQLTPDDATDVKVDPDRQFYRPLSEVDTATEKAKRDAGSLPVTEL